MRKASLEMDCRTSLSGFRQFFAARWADFIATNFRSDAEAARALGVSERTVRNWLAQTSTPSGAVVAFVSATNPEAAQKWRREE